MHQLNVLVLGPNIFISTLIELKPFLKFNLYDNILSINKQKIKLHIAIIHKDFLSNNPKIDILDNNNLIKILVSNSDEKTSIYDAVLKLPTSLNKINSTIEQIAAKKIFNENSSIKIKNYLLDKNEKKLIKDNNFLILTEKEIQLLELFLNQNQPISKNEILSLVWNYSKDADTHTVETHIYRLRKKINDKFFDSNFILNNKEGYYV